MNPVILMLDADQVGQNPITLTTAELASIDAQRSSQVPQPPQPPTGTVPPYVNPQPSRHPSVTNLPWQAGYDIRPGPAMNDTNIWLIPFTTGAFKAGSIATGEWQSAPVFRYLQLVRNRDGAIVLDWSKNRQQTPRVNFLAGPSSPGYVHLDQNERYTLAIWNAASATPPATMFAELQFH